MDSPSSRVTNVANSSRSSRRDSVGDGAMANGVAGSSCDSEDAEEVDGGGGGGGVRARVSDLASVGSVGSLNVASADPDNKEDSTVASEDDADQAKELEELAKLRCQSVATEVVAERYKRRCSDYPGFAFGSSIFSSNTLMKFSIIKNELHNIMNVQLKRVSIHGDVSVRSECERARELPASQSTSCMGGGGTLVFAIISRPFLWGVKALRSPAAHYCIKASPRTCGYR